MWNKELDIIELNYATLRDAQEEAREEGVARGREEERLLLAQRLLLRGMTDSDIADLTALPLGTIALLHQQSMAGS